MKYFMKNINVQLRKMEKEYLIFDLDECFDGNIDKGRKKKKSRGLFFVLSLNLFGFRY